MAFDDLLGPREKVLKTPVNEVDEKDEMLPDFGDGDLDLNDLIMDDEADDNDGNTLGDPWGNLDKSNQCNDCEDDDCDSCGC